jgi:hypothetical protein
LSVLPQGRSPFERSLLRAERAQPCAARREPA